MVRFFFLIFFLTAFFPVAGKTAPVRIYLEFEPPVKEIYIGQETGFKITLFDRIGLQEVALVPPDMPNADVFLLQNKPEREVEKDGFSYDTNELYFNLVAKSVGEMAFPSFCLSASAPTMISARDLPDDIDLLPSGKLVICAPPFSVNVKRLPENSPALFAAKEVRVYDGIVPKSGEIPVGSPVKRSLLLAVTGTLPVFLPDFKSEEIKNAKVYNGKTERNQPFSPLNLKAALRQTVIVVPQKEGELVLPEIRIPWLNAETDQVEISVIPARRLTVSAVPSDFRKKEEPAVPEKRGASFQNGPDYKYFAFAGAVFLLCLAGIFLFVKFLKRLFYRKSLVDAVEKACLSGDAERIEAALLAWAAAFFSEKRFLSLSDIRKMFGGENDEFVLRLEALEEYLYGTGRFAKHLPMAAENLGKDIYDAFRTVLAVKRTVKKEKKDSLPRLYPDDFTSS